LPTLHSALDARHWFICSVPYSALFSMCLYIIPFLLLPDTILNPPTFTTTRMTFRTSHDNTIYLPYMPFSPPTCGTSPISHTYNTSTIPVPPLPLQNCLLTVVYTFTYMPCCYPAVPWCALFERREKEREKERRVLNNSCAAAPPCGALWAETHTLQLDASYHY